MERLDPKSLGLPSVPKGAKSPSFVLKMAFLLTIVLLLETYWGVQIGHQISSELLGIFAGVVLFGLVLFNTQIGLFLLVATFLVSEKILTTYGIPLGPGRLNILDCLVLAVIISWLAKGIFSKKLEFVSSPINLPLLLFLAMSIISGAIGIFQGYDINTVFRELRPLLYYTLFFVVANSICSEEKVKQIVIVFFIVAYAAAILDLFSYVLAFGGLYVAPSLTTESRIFGSGEDTFFALLIVLTLAIFPTKYLKNLKPIFGLGALLMFIALALSYIRSDYIGLIVGVLFLFFVLSSANRAKYLKYLTLLTCGVLIFLLVLSSFPLGSWSVKYTIKRAEGILSPLAVSTIQIRIKEAVVALALFQKYPIFGVGLGYQYHLPFHQWFENIRTGFLHNDYLYLLSKLGLAGIAVLAWLVIAILKRGLFILRQLEDEDLKALLGGILAGIVVILVTSFTAPRLTFLKTAPMVAILFGLIESIGAGRNREKNRSSLVGGEG